MQEWHGAFGDPSLEPVSHYELITLPELIHVFLQIEKVIAVIRITHDDVFASGISNSTG